MNLKQNQSYVSETGQKRWMEADRTNQEDKRRTKECWNTTKGVGQGAGKGEKGAKGEKESRREARVGGR